MTSIPPNIEEFNRLVLALVTELYQQFPVSIEIDGHKKAQIAASAYPESVGDTIYLRHVEMLAYAISFLGEEEMIRHDESRQFISDDGYREFRDVRLTMKGLAVMGMVPDSMDEAKDRRTLYEKAHDALSKTAASVGSDTVKTTVAELLKLAVQSPWS